MGNSDGILPDPKVILEIVRKAKKTTAKCQQQQAEVREVTAKMKAQRIKTQALLEQLKAEHPLDRLWIGWRANGNKGKNWKNGS